MIKKIILQNIGFPSDYIFSELFSQNDLGCLSI